MSETNFTKLFSSITASTIWCESPETKIVWITMLAMSDSAGFVYASIPGLANIAQIDIDKTREAITRFLSPDPDSRDSTNEGRRIEEIEGGWAILNHPKYRKLRDAEERKAYHREYMRKKRESVKSVVKNVKDCEPQSTQAEGEAEEDTTKTLRFAPPTVNQVTEYKQKKRLNLEPARFVNHYQSNGWMVGKTKMKDWKAAARGWSQRENTREENKRSNKPESNLARLSRALREDLSG